MAATRHHVTKCLPINSSEHSPARRRCSPIVPTASSQSVPCELPGPGYRCAPILTRSSQPTARSIGGLAAARFEIVVGAILTQNTSWTNVERAIRNLRAARMLSPQAIRRVRYARLAQFLRPSGYFRQKAKTLKSFVNFLYAAYAGSLSRLFATRTDILRAQLLALRGIGPETTDSILLYAGKHPVFVVDAYTRRILERHGHAHAKLAYDKIRTMVESALPVDHQLFNEFHALIVHVGKKLLPP